MKKAILLLLLCSIALQVSAQINHKGKVNPTGQITIDRSTHPLKAKPLYITKSVLDEAVDLLPYTPVVTQQSFLNCYAYASVYAGRTTLYNISHHITNQPDSTIFSTGFIQKIIYPSTGTCRRNGYDTYVACRIMQDKGIVRKSDYPDDCTNIPIGNALMQKALDNRVIAQLIYQSCDKADDKITAIKNSLSEHKPVVIGWFSVRSFNGGGYGLEVWKPSAREQRQITCRTGANHAICIIGYDDHKSGGAFHIMNSWGTTWGVGGLMWITYKDMAAFSAFGIELSER